MEIVNLKNNKEVDVCDYKLTEKELSHLTKHPEGKEYSENRARGLIVFMAYIREHSQEYEKEFRVVHDSDLDVEVLESVKMCNWHKYSWYVRR
jgi:hypothetical protein